MIVIGADTHKYQHSLAAVDEGSGRQRGSREISADEAGYLEAVRWARGVDGERVWALEDCRHVSRRLEQALVAVGERVIRVAPGRMGASRRGERQPGKSDQIDSLAIAHAVVKDGVEAFPAAWLDQRAMEIRILFDHRERLIGQRTRVCNQLRWQLIELCPELERSLKRGALRQPRTHERINRKLRSLPPTIRARVARELLAQIRALTRQADQSQAELAELINSYRPALLSEQGCGVLTAATLIGHTAGAQTLATDASFAQLAGTAPIPCSSGKHTQYRLNRGGDRQLNRALHTIAVTRARLDPATQQYLARKRAEGKTDKGALRSLKRHLARRVHRLLTQPPQPATTTAITKPPQPAAQPPADQTITATAPAVCLI